MRRPSWDRRIGMSEKECEEDKLVAAARGGDRDAFGELVERHFGRVFRTTRRITRHREDAEDVVQESLANAFVHLEGFTGAAWFSTWLTRIAINAALMRLRKKRLAREVPMEESIDQTEGTVAYEPMDAAPTPEEWYAERELCMILREAVVKLRPTLREAVEVHQMEIRSVQETAEILGISTQAAKGRLFHARAALRRKPHLRAICEGNRRVGGFSKLQTNPECRSSGGNE
jgi:RNA polymerase sigma-70 factor, ECF subfamily